MDKSSGGPPRLLGPSQLQLAAMLDMLLLSQYKPSLIKGWSAGPKRNLSEKSAAKPLTTSTSELPAAASSSTRRNVVDDVAAAASSSRRAEEAGRFASIEEMAAQPNGWQAIVTNKRHRDVLEGYLARRRPMAREPPPSEGGGGGGERTGGGHPPPPPGGLSPEATELRLVAFQQVQLSLSRLRDLQLRKAQLDRQQFEEIRGKGGLSKATAAAATDKPADLRNETVTDRERADRVASIRKEVQDVLDDIEATKQQLQAAQSALEAAASASTSAAKAKVASFTSRGRIRATSRATSGPPAGSPRLPSESVPLRRSSSPPADADAATHKCFAGLQFPFDAAKRSSDGSTPSPAATSNSKTTGPFVAPGDAAAAAVLSPPRSTHPVATPGDIGQGWNRRPTQRRVARFYQVQLDTAQAFDRLAREADRWMRRRDDDPLSPTTQHPRQDSLNGGDTPTAAAPKTTRMQEESERPPQPPRSSAATPRQPASGRPASATSAARRAPAPTVPDAREFANLRVLGERANALSLGIDMDQAHTLQMKSGCYDAALERMRFAEQRMSRSAAGSRRM